METNIRPIIREDFNYEFKIDKGGARERLGYQEGIPSYRFSLIKISSGITCKFENGLPFSPQSLRKRSFVRLLLFC